MNQPRRFVQIRKRRVLLATSALLLGLFIVHFAVYGQDKSSFPDGFDAVQAAPKSHRVVFENAFVRVLEVSVVAGETVRMHHHRWPSLLVSWDTGGKSPHVRYHRADGTVRHSQYGVAYSSWPLGGALDATRAYAFHQSPGSSS